VILSSSTQRRLKLRQRRDVAGCTFSVTSAMIAHP
jgi:hypothetical protein